MDAAGISDKPRLLGHYLLAGVHDDVPLFDQYSIATTRIGILIAQMVNVIILIGTPIILGQISLTLTLVTILAMFAYQASYLLSRKGACLASRLIFSTSLIGAVSWMTFFFGTFSGIQYLLLPVGIGSLMIWPRQRVAQLSFALLVLVVFLALSIMAPAGQLLDEQKALFENAQIPLVNLSLSFVVSFIVVLCLTIGSEHLQSSLDRSLKKASGKAAAREDQLLITLNALALARDNETGSHILRTQLYVKALGSRLAALSLYADLLKPSFVELLYRSAPLHDVGKIGIPDNILLKPGKLNPDEWEVMKSHTTIGESVLRSAMAEEKLTESDDALFQVAIDVAGGHHEQWDGAGYPRGLKGEAIPLAARIMAVADTYDALISERVYKSGWSHEQAMDEIVAGSGTRFDPNVVRAFVIEQERFREIATQFSD